MKLFQPQLPVRTAAPRRQNFGNSGGISMEEPSKGSTRSSKAEPREKNVLVNEVELGYVRSRHTKLRSLGSEGVQK